MDKNSASQSLEIVNLSKNKRVQSAEDNYSSRLWANSYHPEDDEEVK